jgi:hypothetical protein
MIHRSKKGIDAAFKCDDGNFTFETQGVKVVVSPSGDVSIITKHNVHVYDETSDHTLVECAHKHVSVRIKQIV